MSEPDSATPYSIAAVSKLTGISCHTLRVWERRYGFPVPKRSDSGHRRYQADDVAMLRRLAAEVRRSGGRGIRKALNRLRSGADRTDSTDRAVEAEGSPAVLLQLLFQGELSAAEVYYESEAAGKGPMEVAARLLEPALIDSGESWFRGDCSLGQERCASAFLLRKIQVLLDGAQTANRTPRRRILVGTVAGDRHEGGALLVALALELMGGRAIHLGSDLPVSEYQRSIDLWKPDALAVSFVLSRNIKKRFEELSRLKGTIIFVGGRSILNHQALAGRYHLTPLAGRAEQAVSAMLAHLDRQQETLVGPTD